MADFDVGVLAAMLDDDDEFTENITEKGAVKDDLELQLETMEKEMTQLREQIQKKKSPNSQKITDKTIDKTPKPSVSKMVEVDLFQPSAINCNLDAKQTKPQKTKKGKEAKTSQLKLQKNDSVIHTGLTDSSEDEDNREPMTRTLNEYGYAIKRLARTPTYSGGTSNRPKATWNRTFSEGSSAINKLKNDLLPRDTKMSTKPNEKVEPCENYGGIRVLNPLVSSAMFGERLTGRKLIEMHTINPHSAVGDIEGDWVTVGVIISKSEPKVAATGSKYSRWGLSNLKGGVHGMTVVTLFLFGETHAALWKTSVGTVVGILNAKVLPNKNPQKKFGKDEVSLSVDNSLKVMIMGKSKDFGFCKSTRRDGTSCTSIVNKQVCEYCEFHVQSEYKKVSSKRMDLQTSFSSAEPQGFKERILRKEQIMYGGVSYMAQKPEKLSSSKKAKDKLTLQSLNLRQKAEALMQAEGCSADLLTRQTVGSTNLNKFMTSKENKQNDANFISIKPGELLKMHAKQMQDKISNRCLPNGTQKLCEVPKLGKGYAPGESIDLGFGNFGKPVAIDKSQLSKMRAIAKLRQTESKIKKVDPNAVKKQVDVEFQRKVTKRLTRDDEGTDDGKDDGQKVEGEVGHPAKKRAMDTRNEEMLKLINKKSKYDNLLNEEENVKQSQYFHALEKKEMLENKMLSIKEIECTAVSCKQCKYTALSAAEGCKASNHPLAYHKAKKRFFKCKDCSTRTISLSKLPTKACGGCGGANFERAAMWAERKGPTLESEQLSIRGDEVKWLGNLQKTVKA